MARLRARSPAADFAKRVLDLFGSAVGLVLLSPFLLAVGLAITLSDGGPMFYRGIRIGRRGRPFRIYKFRTMVPDAERLGASSTAEDDSRITPIGRFLRRRKVDELPQLLNVLTGDMSLVGPRPQVAWAVALYTAEERGVLDVRPGITDEASLRFRNEGELLKGSAHPDRAYLERIAPEKMRLALHYVREGTLRTDLALLIRTVLVVAGLGDEPVGFEDLTEQWGTPASPEQESMALTRYDFAARRGQGRRVLELACGTGMGLELLVVRASRLFAGDYAWPNVRQAKEHAPPGVPLLRLDAQRLPFPGSSFEVVVLFEALYYLTRPDLFLAECRRVLVPGGELLLALPNRERPGFLPSPLSTRYPSADELRRLLGEAGFDVGLYGGFRIDPAGAKDGLATALRTAAQDLGLIPRTLAGRARLKRLLHPRMKTLGALREGGAAVETLEKIGGKGPLRGFKNLYAVATLRA